jgi:hypothetical protein
MQRSLFYLLFLSLCFSGFHASAQYGGFSTTPVVDAMGRPVKVDEYDKIKGSPYLYDDWTKGEIVTNDGEVYKGLLLKYNANTDLLTFVYDKKDEPQKFAEPVRVFTLYADRERVFANQFPKIDGYKMTSYYEVLLPGNAMLLKKNKELLKPVRSETSRAVVDGVYVSRSTYYIYKDKQIYRLKASRNGVLDLLSDKGNELAAYADSQNIKFERDDDLKKLVNYYNTLQ